MTNQEAGLCDECPLRHCCGGWCADEPAYQNPVEQQPTETADPSVIITGIGGYQMARGYKKVGL